MTIETRIEQIARQAASLAVNTDGWIDNLDALCSMIRNQFIDKANQCPHAAQDLHAVANRAEDILRGYHAALAANDIGTVIGLYFDLMPPELQAKINNGAIDVLRDSGVQVDQFKDESGQTFIRMNGIEKLEIPDSEISRMNAIAGDLPSPVGELHRVH